MRAGIGCDESDDVRLRRTVATSCAVGTIASVAFALLRPVAGPLDLRPQQHLSFRDGKHFGAAAIRTFGGWRVAEISDQTGTDFETDWWVPRNQYDDDVPRWVRLQPVALTPTDAIERGWHSFIEVEASAVTGFPFAAFTADLMYWDRRHPDSDIAHHTLLFDEWTVRGGTWVWHLDEFTFDIEHVLPLTPRPAGVAGNACAWSAAYWLLRFAPVHVRSVSRKRRGLCGACGYDLAGSPNTCPECGRKSACVSTRLGSTRSPTRATP